MKAHHDRYIQAGIQLLTVGPSRCSNTENEKKEVVVGCSVGVIDGTLRNLNSRVSYRGRALGSPPKVVPIYNSLLGPQKATSEDLNFTKFPGEACPQTLGAVYSTHYVTDNPTYYA